MRHTRILPLFLLLPLSWPATAANVTPTAAIKPVRQEPAAGHQQQAARQFGRRIAANPGDPRLDADWRDFIRRQPKHTDIPALLAIVKEEAIRTSERDIGVLRNRSEQARQRMSATQRELAQARQHRTSPAQANKAGLLQRQLERESGMSKEWQLKLQAAMDRQTKFQQTLSNILKKMNDTASAVIQNLR